METQLSKDKKKKISHIAIIMDGNGRWANSRGLPRYEGHAEGLKTLRKLLKDSNNIELNYLTIFSFSIDNWKRPEGETSKLMMLLKKFISNDLSDLHKNNVRIKVIGSKIGIPKDIVELIRGAEELTLNNSGLYLQIAFNYSGRDEIVNTSKRLAIAASKGDLDPRNINKDIFESNLYTAGVPDPDLIIRTGAEKRISNFLLWQLSYAEVYFEDCLWPDFNKSKLDAAINDYMKRSRRYGNIVSGLK
ncbi:MAG: polyprenyl diphosphate synthase [Pseudomonadota bacterium]|nr:polyprenyl diphosphate synthase [Pseudomonadota bacterium]MEC9414703.1 polyprenyl diphosphate synthase [Pseudomonadota bacterium]MEC9481554.1 polyprenyl diphosphate synthase [Pseudomonadota bacterium]